MGGVINVIKNEPKLKNMILPSNVTSNDRTTERVCLHFELYLLKGLSGFYCFN